VELLAPVVNLACPPGRYERRSDRAGLIHPLLAAATVVLFFGCLAAFGPGLRGAASFFFCCVLVVVTATDLEYRVIPNRVVLPAAAILVVAMTAAEPGPEWAIASVASFLVMFAIALVYPAGMGMGDVKLALVIGAALGRTAPVAFAVAAFASFLPALWLLVRRGGRNRGLPFAPFLAIGSIVALFAGDELLDAWLSG
jgi:leader peptidase (prepilin peptidase)/N-methyltransferase